MKLQSLKLINDIKQQRKTTKAVIKKMFGENCIIRRQLDPARIAGISEIFNKNLKLYKTVNPKTGKTLKNIGCHYNDARELQTMYVLDKIEGGVNVYTNTGVIIRRYTAPETDALITYKHDSGEIHSVLRKHEKVDNEEEIRKHITCLENLFKEGLNVSIAQEDMVAYRALDRTSLKQIMSLQEGDIYTDPSFVSVATKKRKIYNFYTPNNFRHPMKIIIPKGSKYISLDELHNIVLPNIPETELLLKGSFEIVKNPKHGLIEVIYRDI